VSDAGKIRITLDPATFWGFLDVPFHQLMGVRFSRGEDGFSVVSLPPSPETVGPDGEQSGAALYTVAEISSALRACEDLAEETEKLAAGSYPVLLARELRFRQLAPAYGEVSARAQFVGDSAEVLERLTTKRKANATLAVRIEAEGGEQVAEAETDFYLRIMTEDRLLAMTGAAAGA
jgi:acyl-coenzyme A thioesterase PaaI-like protein